MNQEQERSKITCSRDEQHFMDGGSTDGGSEYMFSASTGGGPAHSASTTSGGHSNIGGVITSGGGAPCGACKFLRRKCVKGCIFAPHFAAEHGAARFAAVHKIFGASNVNKLLQGLTANQRFDAVITISYEAQARIADPVYGCVGAIAQLQQQVVSLQSELSYVKAQLASCMEQLHACMVVAQHSNGIGNGGPSTTTSLLPFINIEQAHVFDPQLLLTSASTPIVPYYNRESKEEIGDVPLEGTPHVCDSIALGSTPNSSMAINQVQPMHHDQHQHHVFDLLNSKNNHDLPSQHSVLRDEVEIHPLIQARCLNLHEEN